MRAIGQKHYYGWLSIILHWLGAIAMIASFITGEELEDAAGEARAQAYHLHLSWAAILAVPLLLRILWRLYDGFKVTTRQHRILEFLSRIVMVGFLTMIAVMIVTGPLIPWANGESLEIFAWSIPSPFSPLHGLHEAMEAIHVVASKLFLPLLALHVLGALKHAVIDRDKVLWGMLRPARNE